MLQAIIDTALRNKLAVALFGAAVVAAGYWSYRELPVDAFPDISPSLVQIFTIAEGLGPEEVEKFVTYPVEAAMSGLPRIAELRSSSNFGLSVVNVFFEDGTDIYFARQVVGERLSEAREAIPDGFGKPQMGPISTGQGLILYYSLKDTTGEYSLEELRSMQDWVVKFHLQTVPGVTEVLGIGGYVKQFHVNVDPDALLAYGLGIGEVVDAIEANNQNVGGQFIERAGERVIVRSVGLAERIEDLERIALASENGTPVFLRDVADIETGGAIRQGLETVNGEREVVSGMVVKLYGANASTVIEAVEAKLKDIQAALPEGVRIEPYYEQKTLVREAVRTVTRALAQGIGLVAIVVLVFAGGFRPSFVVALSIPFSVLFATLGMRLFDLSANLMSLGGLAIAIGMMVDGAIVMAENVDRRLRDPGGEKKRLQVVSRACGEVGRPLSFAILIVILVFLPLFALQGVEGKMFRPLAYTAALAMLGSLVYALLAAPVFSWAFMRAPGAGRSGKANGDPPIARLLVAIYRPVASFFVRYRLAAAALAAALLAGGAFVYPRLGSEFAPRLEEGDLVANLSMAPSVSLEETKRNALLAEKRILAVPEVRSTHSRIGRGEVGAHADPVNSVHMMVTLKEKEQWREGFGQSDIENAIREALKGMPGVLVNMTQPIQLTIDELIGGTKAQLAIKLFGPDLDTLKRMADEIAAVVNGLDGAADVQPGQIIGAPQLLIEPDREAIARYGLSMKEAQELARVAIGGVAAGQIFEGVRRFDIYVRYEEEARDTVEDIRRLVVRAPGGALVTLGEIARVEEVAGPRQIIRENNQRYIQVQANVVGRDIGGFVAEAKRAVAENVALPDGYLLEWGGQFELQQAANARLGVVAPATLALIGLLLYMSFGSVGNTLLILLNIPLAMVGGVVALWLGGENLSVPSSVGFIALFGVALGNGMVLVSHLNRLVGEGLSLEDASVAGACRRLRPVLMTAATTALGLVPLLLATGAGSEVQRPLATVVVGGLVSSTILTLLVVPALYKWFAPFPR